MGRKQEIKEVLKDYHVTKINSKPMDEDLTKLKSKSSANAASIPTTNEGGLHGHISMIGDKTEYVSFSHNAEQFIVQTNPGPYPTTGDPTNVVMRARQVAEHKVEVIEFKTYLGVAQSLHLKVADAVKPEWLKTIKSPTLGFMHKTPKEMLDHLQSGGTELNNDNIAELITKLNTPWEVNKNLATKFARDNKIEKQLAKKGIMAQLLVWLALAKSAFKVTGKYEVALNNFEAKPMADQTFVNFRMFIINEYSKHNKGNCSTAKSVGFGIANTAQ